jgi:hypothetical protein
VVSTHGILHWIVRTALWTSLGGRIRNGSFGFAPDFPEDQSLYRPSISTARRLKLPQRTALGYPFVMSNRVCRGACTPLARGGRKSKRTTSSLFLGERTASLQVRVIATRKWPHCINVGFTTRSHKRVCKKMRGNESSPNTALVIRWAGFRTPSTKGLHVL